MHGTVSKIKFRNWMARVVLWRLYQKILIIQWINVDYSCKCIPFARKCSRNGIAVSSHFSDRYVTPSTSNPGDTCFSNQRAPSFKLFDGNFHFLYVLANEILF